jgi:hypothetical protein
MVQNIVLARVGGDRTIIQAAVDRGELPARAPTDLIIDAIMGRVISLVVLTPRGTGSHLVRAALARLVPADPPRPPHALVRELGQADWKMPGYSAARRLQVSARRASHRFGAGLATASGSASRETRART